MNDVEVSIICCAYNQEEYIEKTLKSFLDQKTNFKYEVLIHDDASTDNTAQIIKKYENEYPNIIKAVYQKENQYSKNNGVIYEIQNKRVRGKYVALCEGDDYWTDKNKLQKQYDVLESYPEINICTHAATVRYASSGKKKSTIEPSKKDRIFSVEEVIAGGGGFVATNSIFIRASTYLNPPMFRKKNRFDYTLQIAGSLKGGMYYLKDNMSVYRLGSKASVTQAFNKDREKFIKWHQKAIKALEEINKETDYKYQEVIRESILKREYLMLNFDREYTKMIKHPYFKKLNLKEKLKVYIKKFIKYKKA